MNVYQARRAVAMSRDRATPMRVARLRRLEMQRETLLRQEAPTVAALFMLRQQMHQMQILRQMFPSLAQP